MSVTVPEKIGKYPIESLVAKGGMGAVYKAKHPELKRPVIIKKLMIRGNAAIAERFKREAQILLDLNNPRIVHLHDYFQEGSSRYLVLEFVDGMSLDVILRKKKQFSGEMALLVILEAAMALKYAHDKGIVHRDVKPGNILVSRKGEIKLADFGIASDDSVSEEESEDAGSSLTRTNRSKSAKSDLTGSGSMLGTPSYMPPEQFTDSSTVDKRADIYALGVMLYEMLTGAKPFSGGSVAETYAKIRKGSYISIRKLNPSVPSLAVSLVRKMLKADAKKRFRDLDPVIRKIRRYLERFAAKDIRYALVKNMLTADLEDGPWVPKKRNGMRVAFSIFAAASLGALAFLAWNAGLIHQTLLRRWYSPVTVRMELPPDALLAGSGPDSLMYQAFFFRDDDDQIPEIEEARRTLEKGKDSLVLESKPVWLRDGAYRVKITAGNRIWWRTFSQTGDETVIDAGYGKNRALPLSVTIRALDGETGASLGNRARVTVFFEGKYVPLAQAAAAFVTGTVWKFRVEADGYTTKDFSLRIGWYQSELVIDAALQKK